MAGQVECADSCCCVLPCNVLVGACAVGLDLSVNSSALPVS